MVGDRTVNDIAAFLQGPVVQYGPGCLASEEAWATRYMKDVAFLLGALAAHGVDITPTPPSPPGPPETHTWDYWEERLGLRIHDPDGLGTGDQPLTRREFLEGYMDLVERGEVNTHFAGHQVLLKEMQAIAMEGVPR